MTASRFLLLLGVIVFVLFAVSLAVQRKTSSDRTSPTQSWVSRFNERFQEGQKLDVANDLKSDCQREQQFSISKLQTECAVVVKPNLSRRIRKAEIRVSEPSLLSVRYLPSREDPEAMELKVDRFEAKQPLKLVFLPHGGTLMFTRNGPAVADAIITIK